MRTLLALLVFAAAAAPEAQTWPEPGEGFAWETVGDWPVTAKQFAFDVEGRIWAGWSGSPGGVARLDDPDDPAATWATFDPFRDADTVLPLGRGDTVLSGFVQGIRRTTDGGATWAEVFDIRTIALYEVPALPGLPGDLRAGDLFSVSDDGFHRSTDRGATWAPVPGAHAEDAVAVAFLPEGHPLAGRLLVSTTFGGSTSARLTPTARS